MKVEMSDLSEMFRAWSVKHIDMVRSPTRLSANEARLAHAELVIATMPRDRAGQEMDWYRGVTEALLAQAAA